MGRTGRPALTLGTAAVLVAATGTCVVLTRDEPPVAQAATMLAGVHNAQIVSATGRAMPARDGQRVPNGAVVRTGPTGSAQLLTRGRVVYVEHSAAVAVLNGAHQQLRTGGALVDAQHGPGVRFDLAGDVVAIPDGSATEAMRSVTVEVGSLAGPSTITSSSARRLTVQPLAQVVINGEALPATTTPLHLNDGDAEAQAVPTLVNDDVQLTTLAAGIDASGAATASLIETAWTGPTTAEPKAAPRSEQVLPMVIADATSGGSAADRYHHAVSWRRAGGSWGVVIELLSGHAGGVEKVLASLQPRLTGRIGKVQVQALAGPNGPNGLVGPGRGGGDQPSSHHPSTPTTTPPHSGSGGGRSPGGGSPTPKPSSGPVKKVVDTVTGVVGTVVGLLPVKPPTPHPSKSSGGLLGGLLGH
jgi:hypothetical protein